MRRGRHISAIVAALLAATSLATLALADKKDNTLRFASEQVLTSADPYFNTGILGVIIAENVWDTLIYRDEKSGLYVGNLATAWRWIDDKTLELDLRRGVKFHNGADFDADDVVYTFNFVSNPKNRAARTTPALWID